MFGKTLHTTEICARLQYIANNGIYCRPILYTKVLTNEGQVMLYDDSLTQPHQVLKKETATTLTDIMCDVISSPDGLGTKAAFKDIQMPAAGITGTTSDNKDLYFVGYTPYYIAAIWAGYDEQPRAGISVKPFDESVDHAFVQTIWRDIVENIHKELNLPEKGVSD